MKNAFCLLIYAFGLGWHHQFLIAQTIVAGQPLLEEAMRRAQLTGEKELESSFLQRPLKVNWAGAGLFPGSWEAFYSDSVPKTSLAEKKQNVVLLPVRLLAKHASGRPIGPDPYLLLPAAGGQYMAMAGVEFRNSWIHAYFQPIFSFSANPPYDGFNSINDNLDGLRFRVWMQGDTGERLYPGRHRNMAWGNSKLAFQLGALELGVSTENLWWGPGQFHALTFSHHAPGFMHLTLNTHRPLRTFLGDFEGQFIMGRLEGNWMPPSQHDDLNRLHFTPPPDDWRYLNAFNIIYSPKWLKGLHVGLSRTFQQFEQDRVHDFWDWVPVLEPFQKSRFFDDGHSVRYDARRQDQQATVYARYQFESAKMEWYMEYGRRDHAFTWREFLMNPEHARAYILGFQKLFPTGKNGRWIQVRGEMAQGSQSINQLIRYGEPPGNYSSWHSHYQALGFRHRGQMLGLGQSGGTDVQVLELAWVQGLDKLGIQLERQERFRDFYRAAFYDLPYAKPWVDLGMRVQYSKQYGSWLVDSTLGTLMGFNYQWNGNLPDSNSPFGRGGGNRRLDWMGQLQVFYLIP
ncbi:capsule assembly Wzi family protein [Pleomorphovibrio marinus]|uniref:capsule assembly Wzi family protein n=1 Tax=Pleomorphovibrio marinus TaxID=2164132 RepID=UPI000E0B80F5|nr:capsule assembly Wzi family protein [Pleomorphovibrio marinus]